jgi:hypothetical protein
MDQELRLSLEHGRHSLSPCLPDHHHSSAFESTDQPTDGDCVDGDDQDDLPLLLEAVCSPQVGGLGSPHAITAFPHFSERDFYYLQYLLEQGAQYLLNMDSGDLNPLRYLLVPRAYDSTGVLTATCAVAACHQAQRAHPDMRISCLNTAASFYLRAIRWLRRSFDPVGFGSSPKTVDDAALFAAVLLCKYEIIQGSVHQWRKHLDGLDQMLQLRGGIYALDRECGQYIASLYGEFDRMVDTS